MKAVVLDGQGGLRLEERPKPTPGPGEALVRVLVAGICATDLELQRGYMGFQGIPGHEFCGVVERADSKRALVGKRVAGEINCPCLGCEFCEDKLERHCPNRTVLGILGRDGAFAEYLVIPVANLHPIPDKLPTDRAVFTEPCAAAFEITEQIKVSDRHILVMGCGRLGRLCARVLDLKGAHVTILGRHERKLAPLAADGFHTVHATDAAEVPPTMARHFEVVVEATGSPEGIAQAFHYVRPRGTIVLKSTCAEARPIQLAPIVIDELTVLGSRCGPFAPALKALSRGDLKPEQTIDARRPLEQAAEAFATAGRPGVRKVLLDVAAG